MARLPIEKEDQVSAAVISAMRDLGVYDATVCGEIIRRVMAVFEGEWVPNIADDPPTGC